MDDVQIEITFDEPYLRELHEEWIAAVGRGWRVDRVMIPLFAAGSVVSGAVGLAWGGAPFLGVGAFMGAVAGFEAWRGRRALGAWLAYQRSLPWHGRTMTVVVRDGALVQVKAFEGDPRFERTGEILPTPNGWLVRYEKADAPPVNAAVSASSASVYLRHRSIRPAMSREAFEALIGLT